MCIASVVVLPFSFAPRGWAEAKGDVEVHLTAKKVVVTDEKEALESADKAKPGDLIQYDAVYKNTTQAAVKNLQATVPVPQGLAFVAESAKPAGAQASTDGKTFHPIPLTREVKKPDGTIEQEPVPLSEYRAIRWTIAELPASGSTTVSLRARVLTNATGH